MIDLTPLDVRKKKGDFRRGLRGYESEEVDAFLDMVADRFEELVRENSQLRERSREQSIEVGAFRGREQALNEALVSAQELREDIRAQAEKASELRVREAEAEGERRIQEAKRQVERQREALEQLQAQRGRFIRSYRGFLEAQLVEITLQEERILRSRTGEFEPEIDVVGDV
ncbi:MAG: DivIVA domain-containing protein [Gemmatimonas sp.]|nr:DivIVA domain-containing protein [Gemmatimonas sp.]